LGFGPALQWLGFAVGSGLAIGLGCATGLGFALGLQRGTRLKLTLRR